VSPKGSLAGQDGLLIGILNGHVAPKVARLQWGCKRVWMGLRKGINLVLENNDGTNNSRHVRKLKASV